MNMGLTGTLDAFDVAEVLQLLASTAQTGCLRIEGERGEGRLWLRDGEVAAISTDGGGAGPGAGAGPGGFGAGGARGAAAQTAVPVDEALSDLMRYDRGVFSFGVGDVVPPEANPLARPEPVDDLLGRASSLLAEWKDLEAVVPSLGYRVVLVPVLPDEGQVIVRAEQWPALVAVGAGCTVGDLAQRMRLTELNVLRLVRELIESGLVALDPSGAPAPAAPSAPPGPSAASIPGRRPPLGGRTTGSTPRVTGSTPRVIRGR
jgi:hypothetical protein